jgi:hypothetical protein
MRIDPDIFLCTHDAENQMLLSRVLRASIFQFGMLMLKGSTTIACRAPYPRGCDGRATRGK